MALVVGTDAYISQADADAYWLDRNNAAWAAASSDEKDAAIREATQYLDGEYAWVGSLADYDQVLGWPRVDAYDDEGRYYTATPSKVEQATAELALEALSGRLVPAEERDGQVKREKVGTIEQEYFEGAPGGRSYRFVTQLLSGLIEGSGSGIAASLRRA